MTKPVAFHPVQAVRLYQRIVEQIEDTIARGELRPGQRLPSERELVEQFGASRSTVREALRVLESTGVVRSRPGDPNGPEILPFSTSTFAKQLTRLTQVDQVSLADLICFRMVLDSSANMMAARLRTDEELAEIESTIVEMRAALDGGYDRFSAADVAFHDAVARTSRSVMLQVCNQVVRGAVLSLIADKIVHARNSKALMRQTLLHHEEVFALIREGDGQAAARVSRRNLFDYYGGYVPKAERGPLEALLLDPPE